MNQTLHTIQHTAETATYSWHTDPSHGWLEVSAAAVHAVDLHPALAFSQYSYHKGNTLYLEEDCDAGVFINAFEAKYGKRPTMDEKDQSNGDSFIRGLPRIGG